MKKRIDYDKILKKILKEDKHNIAAIRQICEDAKKNNAYIEKISVKDIVVDYFDRWTSDEKASLLRIFGYNNEVPTVEKITNFSNMDYVNEDAMIYCLKCDHFTGFDALAQIYFDIKHDNEQKKYSAYLNRLKEILKYCKDKSCVGKYLYSFLSKMPEEELNYLLSDCYVCEYKEDSDHMNINVVNENIISLIIKTKDLELIRKYIKYVNDINLYLNEAVNTRNTKIVRYFLEKGADINYISNYPILAGLTPIKTAIKNGDFKMYNFLIKNGANINMRVIETDFLDKLFNGINLDKGIQEKIKDSDIEELRFVRESSPIEFATKILKVNYHYAIANPYIIFYGSKTDDHNIISKDTSWRTELSRGKIIRDLYSRIGEEKRKKVDYNDLIIFTFITRNVKHFEQYIKDAKKYNAQIDLDKIIKYFYEFNLECHHKEFLSPFIKYYNEINPNSKIILKLLEAYINKYFSNDENHLKNGQPQLYMNDFLLELLNKLPSESKKMVCIMPYCSNLKICNEMLNLGFDINEVDKNGNTMLINLLSRTRRDITDEEFELFEFLLDNADISIKNKEGKTALDLAVENFRVDYEWHYQRYKSYLVNGNTQKAAVMLINKTKKEDLLSSKVGETLEYRYNKVGDDFEKTQLSSKLIYIKHKDLFNALITKEFVFSDKLLETIFDGICFMDEETKEFVYGNLDRNIVINKTNMQDETDKIKKVISELDPKDSNAFAKAEKEFALYSKKVLEVKKHYEEDVPKKTNPELYVKYAQAKYKNDYTKLDSYAFEIIMAIIRKFGIEKLPVLLKLCPSYDINYYVKKQDINFNMFNYAYSDEFILDITEAGDVKNNPERFLSDEMERQMGDVLYFTGGFMQYAILLNNLDIVKYLNSNGAKIKFIVDGQDYTWDYVNSYTMLNYVESIVGSKKYKDLDEQEIDYFKKLTEPKSSS